MTRSPRNIIILGATGSIGTSALEVLEALAVARPGGFRVRGLAAGSNVERLCQQAARWGVRHLAIAEPNAAPDLDSGTTLLTGPAAAVQLVEAIAQPGDLVIGAMVGVAGLPATLAAIDRGCDIALANKETLVAAGAIVMPRVRERGVRMLPVDSEHSAVAQCLRSGHTVEEVRKIILTASGGPFRTWSAEAIANATIDDALNHPTWSMGRKVTVDSATMMNKALEIIEAHWLFGLPADRIEAIVHPQSIVHSFVEFVDGSTIAQLSPPDMRVPIQHAITAPERVETGLPSVPWGEFGDLAFEPVDHARFPAVGLARRAIEAGGTAGAILNAANEEAVAAFLAGAIAFGDIPRLVSQALDQVPVTPLTTLEEAMEADRAARAVVRPIVEANNSASVSRAGR